MSHYVPRICQAAEDIWKNKKLANIHDAMAAAGLLIEFCETNGQLAHTARWASLGVLAACQSCPFFANVYQFMMQHDQSVMQSVAKYRTQVDVTHPGDQQGQASIMAAIDQLLAKWFTC